MKDFDCGKTELEPLADDIRGTMQSQQASRGDAHHTQHHIDFHRKPWKQGSWHRRHEYH